MVRAAHLVRPRFVLVENVPPAVHAEGGHADRVEAELERLSYETCRVLVRFDRLGVPKARNRHVLLGARRETFDHTWAEERLAQADRERRDVGWAIGDLEEEVGPEGLGLFDCPPSPSGENRVRMR